MARIPQPLPKAARVSGLTKEDEFLLSLVDGVLDERELCLVTGRGLPAVQDALDELAGAGAIAIEPRPAPAVREDDEQVELTAERRREVRELHDSLPWLDDYALLRVARSATRTEIRAAYHQVAASFHPDRHFRKNLGSYKKLIEAIFLRITRAYQNLAAIAPSEKPPSGPVSAPGRVPEPRPRIPSSPEIGGFRRVPEPRPRMSSSPESKPTRSSAPPRAGSDPAIELERTERTSYTRVRKFSEPGLPAACAPSSEGRSASDEEIAARARDELRRQAVRRGFEAFRRGDHDTAAAAFADASTLAPHDHELRRLAVGAVVQAMAKRQCR